MTNHYRFFENPKPFWFYIKKDLIFCKTKSLWITLWSHEIIKKKPNASLKNHWIFQLTKWFCECPFFSVFFFFFSFSEFLSVYMSRTDELIWMELILCSSRKMSFPSNSSGPLFQDSPGANLCLARNSADQSLWQIGMQEIGWEKTASHIRCVLRVKNQVYLLDYLSASHPQHHLHSWSPRCNAHRHHPPLSIKILPNIISTAEVTGCSKMISLMTTFNRTRLHCAVPITR